MHLTSAKLFLLTDESKIDENTEIEDTDMENENENIFEGETEDSEREEESEVDSKKIVIQSDDVNNAEETETNGFDKNNSP